MYASFTLLSSRGKLAAVATLPSTFIDVPWSPFAPVGPVTSGPVGPVAPTGPRSP